ncbi:flagellar protein MotY [Photobacterium toruni]|uniref:Putative lipoprotein YiaD n=1 Tax=Photobacterium toruni TaxID=1935446 RepID=A0A1T4NRJ2_9GAMM|nr:OmpA family protein [Photobacterium toruni]SJZ81880.1 putative lipoprotein YiaD precursor [Photobacterium toruni]
MNVIKLLTPWFRSGLIVSVFLSMPMAVAKNYLAQPSQSQWQLVVNTPLECRLNHVIPRYGSAQFSALSSKTMNLHFELKMHRRLGTTRNVKLTSMPPLWMPGDAAYSMTNLKFFKQFDGYIDGNIVWQMLAELEDGRNPTFSYKTWPVQQQRQLEVGLSAVNFNKSYQDFSQCLNNLMPFSFDDIAFTILHYNSNSDELDNMSQKRLAQIANYVRYSDDIDLVLVAAYSDSALGTVEGQRLSEQRADKIEHYFKALGLPENRIQVEAHGKRRPIADNSTPVGRNQNRRVVISLGRSEV